MSRRNRLVKGPPVQRPLPFVPVDYAFPSDADSLIAFLREVRSEVDGGRADDVLMEQTARELCCGMGGAALVVRGRDRIEASLGVRLDRRFLARSGYLRVLWHLVLPELRFPPTGHAKSLLVAAKQLADELGRPLILEEVNTEANKRKIAMIERHLAPAPAMAVFAYEPGGGAAS